MRFRTRYCSGIFRRGEGLSGSAVRSTPTRPPHARLEWGRQAGAHEFLLSRLEQTVDDELPQPRGIIEFQRHRERHDIASPRPAFPRRVRSRARSFSVVTSVSAVAPGFGDQGFDLGLRERMMIGEGALPDHLDAAGAQRPEEAAGIADPGKGQHALAAQRGQRGVGRLQMRRQHRLAPRGDLGGDRFGRARRRRSTISASVRASCGDQRRAQRAGGKHAGRCRGRDRHRSRSARHPWRAPGSESHRPSGSRWRPASAPARRRSARSRATTTGIVARQHQRLVADIGGRVPVRIDRAPGRAIVRHSRG